MTKKRGNNKGSLFQRKDGRWVGEVLVKDQRVTKYFKTQTEGRAWLKKTTSEIENGLNFFGGQTTLREFFVEWCQDCGDDPALEDSDPICPDHPQSYQPGAWDRETQGPAPGYDSDLL